MAVSYEASCTFCERDPLEKRVFYDRGDWYALLAAPAYTKGHTIVARKKTDSHCPRLLLRAHFHGLDAALADVVEALRTHFQPKDVLVASLRGLDPHVHWHLIPLWAEEEGEWRRRFGFENGHLFEFMAHLDVAAQSHALAERTAHGWSVDEQRESMAETLLPDVRSLNALCREG